MGILALDEHDRVIDWQEKPKQPKSDLASMGVYVFSKKTLRRWLSEDRADFGANVIPAMLEAGARVFGYRYNGYWQDVGHDPVVLGGQHGPPRRRPRSSTCTTRTGSSTPAPRNGRRPRSGPTAQVHRSLISHGCVIAGTVVNSVLSPGVRVDVGAVVRDSIVMFDSVIRSGAVVDRAILDKEVVVGPGAIVGEGPFDDRPNRQEPGRLNTGITVVGKHAIVPRGVRGSAATSRSPRTFGPRTSPAGSCAAASRSSPVRASATRAAAAPQGRRSRRSGARGPARETPRAMTSAGYRRARRAPGPRSRSVRPMSEGLVGRTRARSPCRASRPRRDRQLGSRPRRPPPLRPSRDGHPRPGPGGHLLGALRAADQRHVPQVVPQAPALERRVPVRQVLGRRGRAAAARRRAADRERRAPISSAWRSPGSSASPTDSSRNRRTGSGSAAACPTSRADVRRTRPCSTATPLTACPG